MNKELKTYSCYFEFTGHGEYGIRAKHKREAISKCMKQIKKDKTKPEIALHVEEVLEEEK